MTSSAKRAASAIPSTTVAGPRVASPAAYTPSILVLKEGRPFLSSSMPLAVMRASSTCSPTAEITRSQGMSKNSPLPTGLRRPEASASPSTIFSHVSTPFACLTGAASSANVTPSASASANSCSSAGIYLRVRRYTSVTCSAPLRLARRAASMAVLPPPITATLPATAILPALTPFIHWMAPATSPGISSLPGFHAPTAKRIWV